MPKMELNSIEAKRQLFEGDIICIKSNYSNDTFALMLCVDATNKDSVRSALVDLECGRVRIFFDSGAVFVEEIIDYICKYFEFTRDELTIMGIFRSDDTIIKLERR